MLLDEMRRFATADTFDPTTLEKTFKIAANDLQRDLASSPLPFDHPPMPMYVMWHLRHRHDPVHAWLRNTLEAVVPEALGNVPGSDARLG